MRLKPAEGAALRYGGLFSRGDKMRRREEEKTATEDRRYCQNLQDSWLRIFGIRYWMVMLQIQTFPQFSRLTL